MPGPIAASLSGTNPDVRVTWLARRDGSFDVLLYRKQAVWDRTAKADIAVPTVSETITFARVFRTARVLRVNDGTAPAFAGVAITNRAVTLPVGAGISIVRMIP